MNRIFNLDGYDAEIVLENGSFLLSPEDKSSIETELSNVNIGFCSIELRSGPQASLFQGIVVFINENLTSLIIGSLLMPAAYDALKFVFKKIVDNIKNGPIHIVSTKKITKPNLIMKFKTKKGALTAVIPYDLSDVQFEKYINLLNSVIQSLTGDMIVKVDLIVEIEINSENVSIKTPLEYGKEKCEKQQIKGK